MLDTPFDLKSRNYPLSKKELIIKMLNAFGVCDTMQEMKWWEKEKYLSLFIKDNIWGKAWTVYKTSSFG